MHVKHTTSIGCFLLCISTKAKAQDNLLSIAASLFNQVPTSAYGGIISAAQSVYSQVIATPSVVAPTPSSIVYSTSAPFSSSLFTTSFTSAPPTTSPSPNSITTTAIPSTSAISVTSTVSSITAAAQPSSTTAASSSSSSTTTTTGHHIGNGAIIALAVVCGLLGLGLILAIVYFCRRRSKKAHRSIGTDEIETWRLGTSRSRRSNSKHYSDRSTSSGGFVPIPLPAANMIETSHNRRQPSSLTRFSSLTSGGDDSIVSPIEPDVAPTWLRSKSKRVNHIAIEEEREPARDRIGSPTSPAEMEGSSMPWIAQKMSKMGETPQQQRQMQQQRFIYPSSNEASSFDFGLVDNSDAAPGRTSDTFAIPRRPIG